MSVAAFACFSAIIAAAAVPWIRGSAPERLGGSFNLAVAMIDLLTRQIVGQAGLSTMLLTTDGVLAMGFLVLALRYGNLWLGGALMFQATQFSLHAFYLVTGRPFDLVHAVVNNLDNYGVAACILIGAAVSGRSRQAWAPA